MYVIYALVDPRDNKVHFFPELVRRGGLLGSTPNTAILTDVFVDRLTSGYITVQYCAVPNLIAELTGNL